MAQSTNRFLALADRPFAREINTAFRRPYHARQNLFPKTVPETYAAIRDLDAMIQRSGLEKALIELVKIRASQINGCAFCLDMHARDARKHGETEQRLYLLNRNGPGASRSRMDRVSDAASGRRRAGRRVSDAGGSFHSGGDRESHGAHRRDQPLEPGGRRPELADAEGGMTATVRHAETDAEFAVVARPC